MRVELIKTNASDEDVARAAWISTYDDPRVKDISHISGLISYLYRNKHMSPFEHGSFTFMVECPIFVAREFFRHRTQSFNERSGRYSELIPKFYVPSPERPKVQEGKVGAYHFTAGSENQNALTVALMERVYEGAWIAYQQMLEAGIAKEVARDILPVGIYTSFYATVNPRNLMQFLTLRTADNALYEIRDVANQMQDIFAETMPITFQAYAYETYAENIAATQSRETREEIKQIVLENRELIREMIINGEI